MAITHTETITKLTIVNNSDNIISDVEVNIKSVDDSNPSVLTIESTEYIGITTEGITTSTSGFIPYENLDQNTILNWTEVVNGISESYVKTNHTSWIESVKNPPTLSHVDKELPW